MATSALYRNTDGQLVSVGEVMADPPPAGMTVVALSAQDAAGLQDGSRMWDPSTRTVVANPEWVDPAVAEGNRQTLEASLETYIAGANVALADMAAVPASTNPIEAAAQATFSNITAAQTAVRALQTQVKTLAGIVERIAQIEETHIRKTVGLARYVSGRLDSLENT